MSYTVELFIVTGDPMVSQTAWRRTVGFDDGAINLYDVIAAIEGMRRLVEPGDVPVWRLYVADDGDTRLGDMIRVTADKAHTIVVPT